jgi:hypothetical protein
MIEYDSITNAKTFTGFTDRNDYTAGFMTGNDITIFFIATAQMFTINSSTKKITKENVNNE